MTNIESFIVKVQNENGAKAIFQRESVEELRAELVEASGWDAELFDIEATPFGLQVEVEPA